MGTELKAPKPTLTARGTGAGSTPDFASTVLLTVVLALAGVGVALSVAMLAVAPAPIYIGNGVELTARQNAETAVFLSAYFVFLPLALIAGPRMAQGIAAGPNGAGLRPLALGLGAALAAVVVAVRLADVVGLDNRSGVLLSALVGWWAVAATALARARQPRPWPLVERLSALVPVLAAIAAVLVFAALVTVAHTTSLSAVPIVLGVVIAPLILLTFARWRSPRLSGRWGVVVDVGACVLLFLLIVDLVFITPEAPGATFAQRFKDSIMLFHQTFLLGPTNQVLGGHTLLVDNSSQYGVGSIYFLAGWFQIAPIGYGTLALLDSIVTGLYFVAGYVLLRVCRVSRVLAASALALGVVVMVFSLTFPLGGLVQEGPVRFGLPLLLILAFVAGERWPRRRRAARAATLAVLAIASLWAMEAFAYTGATFLVLMAFEAWLEPSEWPRRVARQLVLALGACAVVHVLFALITLAAAGQLPDWSQYGVHLKSFLIGDLSEYSYDFKQWSPALAVAAGYVASAVTIVLLVRMQPAKAARERPILFALAGLTAYGVWFFAYFVNRSEPHVLAYCCPPLLLVGALWLTLLRRSERGAPGRPAVAAFAAALALSVLLITVAWQFIGSGFERSALAHALPGWKSARGALDRLWHFPPFDPNAAEGVRLLDRYMPGEDDSVVIVKPNLDTEILMRSGRSNRLPIAMAVSDSFVADAKLPAVRDEIETLRTGTRALVDRNLLAALAAARDDPNAPVLTSFGSATAPLQVLALLEIDKRFRIRPVHSSPSGLVVVELERR